MDSELITVKPRRSNKPPSVKASVIAKRVNGESISQIARETGISRPTVYTIIDESNLDRMMEDGRLGVMKQVPKALDVLDARLNKQSESAAIWLLDKCFEEKQGTGKRMAGDVTLNQTLQVLLRSGEDEKLKSPVINVVESSSTDK